MNKTARQIASADISTEDAWSLTVSEYSAGAELYERRSPEWALWFVKNILIDHWVNGESIIFSDASIMNDYLEYIRFLKMLGLINYSIDGDPDYHSDSNYQIIARKLNITKSYDEKRKPVNNISDIEDAADRIGDIVKKLKQKKVEALNED